MSRSKSMEYPPSLVGDMVQHDKYQKYFFHLSSVDDKYAYPDIRSIYRWGRKYNSFERLIFSDLNPRYERVLMKEIFDMRTIIGFTMDEIMNMPVADRHYFIKLHNERISKENAETKGMSTPETNTMMEVKQLVDKSDAKKATVM